MPLRFLGERTRGLGRAWACVGVAVGVRVGVVGDRGSGGGGHSENTTQTNKATKQDGRWLVGAPSAVAAHPSKYLTNKNPT